MSDKPAFPLVLTETERLEAGGQFWLLNEGLTRRELFAMAALNGLCSCSAIQEAVAKLAKPTAKGGVFHLVESAVEHADALIAELDKDKADD